MWVNGVLAIALAGCGRFGFEETPFDGSVDDADRSYRGLILGDSPAAYWRLGESASGIARDEVGNTDGTYVGDCQFGVVGAIANNGAVRFPQGAPQCMVTFGEAFEFTARTAFTIEAWISPSDSFPFGHVFSRQIRDGDGPLEGYALLESPSGIYAERIIADSNRTTDNIQVEADVFVHAAMTYDGSEVRLYIDGALVGTPRADPRDGIPFSATAMIGCATFEVNCFDGVIDEVAVYDRALPQTTIAAHHAAR